MHEHSKKLTTPAQAADFIFAGMAIFTVLNRATGNRFTFRVKRADARPGLADTWFVGLLTGPDNQASYSYLGFIRDGQYFIGKKIAASAASQKAAAWLFPRISQRRALPEPAELWTSGKCGRCGRALTVPESIERGIGPECWSQIKAA